MNRPIRENVTWVGKIDWELRRFHGEEYSTHRGSSYNSYLVQDQKTVLIDTVWAPFAKEFVENLKKTIDLKRIDYVVANHAEIDHSGALPELMKLIPDKPLLCTANGVKSLRGHYHQDWNFQPVKTGDTIPLGKYELLFIEAPMLHWPDSMFCYLKGAKLLFSNDAFGQHYASEFMFNDLVDQAELFAEAIKYYANILTPFSPLVTKKINEFVKLNLPLEIICPSHGMIWRQDPLQIVQKYLAWANEYQENQITIVYETMWDGTRKMAEAIASGISAADPQVSVKLFHSGRADMNDILTEIFRSKAVLLGSPTINQGILSAMARLLDVMRGLKFRGKKAAAFGCYGWSGESVKVLNEKLQECGFNTLNEGLRLSWNPDEQGLESCRSFGKQIVDQLQGEKRLRE